MCLLHRGRHAGADGARRDEADPSRPSRRSDLRHGAARRVSALRPHEVLDHWMVRKPAYRVTLENGTELITSADHRFLTGRGWKHVVGAEQGPLQRPHLTLNSKLMGTGAFADGPIENRGLQARLPVRGHSRRRSSFKSAVRANGRQGHRVEPFPTRVDGLRSARSRAELPRRSRGGDHELPVQSRGRADQGAAGDPDLATSIRRRDHASSSRGRAARRWTGTRASSPASSTPKGTSAEAVASGSATRTRRSSTGRRSRVADSGLPFVVENAREGMWNVRIRGGLEQQLRFFHLTDPAITRKRSIQGRAVKSQSRLRVTASSRSVWSCRSTTSRRAPGDFIATA